LDVQEITDLALAGEHQALRDRCVDAVAGGTAVADLVVDALGPAQVEVGERWLRNEISVADEHLATAGVDSALAALEVRLPAPGGGPRIVCVCAEGEWHAAAARMVALVLDASGLVPIFLGPSLGARDLAAFARSSRAEAVAISCATAAALPGAARCVAEVAAAHGPPVVVGGNATTAIDPALLGAPVVADPRQLAGALDSLPGPAPVALDHAAVAELDLHGRALVDATSTLLGDGPVVREAVDSLVGFARAATLLGDRTIVEHNQPWLDTYLRARNAGYAAADVAAAVVGVAPAVLEHPDRLCGMLAA
jgi:MerR family transcriptional regulator, light-induced transcriptional regulator